MVRVLVEEEEHARMNASMTELNEANTPATPRRHSDPPMMHSIDLHKGAQNGNGAGSQLSRSGERGNPSVYDRNVRASIESMESRSPHLKLSLERAISALSEQNSVINELKETNQRLMQSLEEKRLHCLRLEGMLRDKAAAIIQTHPIILNASLHETAGTFGQAPAEPVTENYDRNTMLLHSRPASPPEVSPVVATASLNPLAAAAEMGEVDLMHSPKEITAAAGASEPGGVRRKKKESFSEIELAPDSDSAPLQQHPLSPRNEGTEAPAPQAHAVPAVIQLASVQMHLQGDVSTEETKEEAEEEEDERELQKLNTLSSKQARAWDELTSKEASDKAHPLDKLGVLDMLVRPVHACRVHFVKGRNSRNHISKYVQVKSTLAALFGIFGLVSSVIQNELVMRGDSPLSPGVTVLKLLNSLSTILCLIAISHVHWYFVLSERLDLHMKLGYPYNDSAVVQAILRRKSYWLETVLCAIHLPPGCTFVFGSTNMGNFVLYRAEALDFLVCSLRLYLGFRVFVHWMLTDLPNKHIVSLFSSARVGPFFALKRCFEGWQAIKFITFLWVGVIVIAGYLFRLSEMSACVLASGRDHPGCAADNAEAWSLDAGESFFDVSNDLYIWNSFWVMFITSITVGYGDLYPVTHLGRFVAVLAALLGIVLASVLTASLEGILVFSPAEHSARMHMQGAKAREKLQEKAAHYICAWLRAKQQQQRQRMELGGGGGEEGAEEKKRHGMEEVTVRRQEFWACKARAERLAREDDCTSVEDKVAKALRRVIYMEAVLERVNARLKATADAGAAAAGVSAERRMSRMSVMSTEEGLAPPLQGGERRASIAGVMGLMGSMQQRHKPRPHRLHEPKHDSDWRVNKKIVEHKAIRAAQAVSLLALLGFLCALVANELVLADINPRAPWIQVLKTLNMLLSLASLPFLYRSYMLRVLLERLVRQRGLAKLEPHRLNVEAREVVQQPLFWLEVLVCAVHLPPGVTFELGTTQLSNFVMYRGETLFFMLNLLRCYLLVRVVKDHVLARMAHLHSIASVHRIHCGYRFVAKHLHNSGAATSYILLGWLTCICLLASLTRAAEFPACDLAHSQHPQCQPDQVWVLYGSEMGRDNFRYYQNAWWCMFVTGTTVGYGDLYPVTHLGRLFASLSAVSGVFATSLLTAALIKSLTRSSEEECAYNFLRRERAIERVPAIAVSIIARAVRHKQSHKRLRQRIEASMGNCGGVGSQLLNFVGWDGDLRQHKLFEELRYNQALVQQSPEEMASTEVQVDLMLKRVMRLSEGLDIALRAVRAIQRQTRHSLRRDGAPARVESGGTATPLASREVASET